MVSLRSGKKVPFLGKNIPKRSYSYKKPIPTAEESELISKIGSISIHEPTLPGPQTDGQDSNINDDTYGSMPSLEGSIIEDSNHQENFDTSDDHTKGESTMQSDFQSEIEIDTADGTAGAPETLGIIQKFEAEMSLADKQFKLMGLLNASTKLMKNSSSAFLDSSNASESSGDSTPSNLSRDMTEDSILTSDVSSSTVPCNESRQQNIFSDISSASSLSSTLKTMIDKAIDSDTSSSDEDDYNDSTRQFIAEDERRPNFSENSYQDIYERYNQM